VGWVKIVQEQGHAEAEASGEVGEGEFERG
jgi:hypothetical protein